MAHVYVDSNAAGAGTGADWANAYTTLAAALTAKAAGDNFWVAQDHAETQASAMTLTAPGTSASPNTIICVNKAGSVPPVSADLATTGTVTTTGNSALAMVGHAYIYGLTFSAGSGAVTAALNLLTSAGTAGFLIFDICKLVKAGTSAASNAMLFGNSSTNVANRVVFKNTTVQFGATGDSIAMRNADFVWENTASAIAGATLPTTLFLGSSNLNGLAVLRGVDLSALTSGKTLVGATNTARTFRLYNCKLGASVTVAAAATFAAGTEVILINCDSGDTNYRTEKHIYMGSQTPETTIVRTGGASDGTTPIAWKIVTTANAEWLLPFESLPITIWNDTLGSITLDIEGIWGGGAVPNNDDIWMEVEYLGTTGFPLSTFVSTGLADFLATPAALSAGSGTWGGSTTKFKMSATFTPAEKGPITVRIYAAAVSSTFYIDPRPVISGVTVSKSLILAPGVYANELSSGSGGGGIRIAGHGGLAA